MYPGRKFTVPDGVVQKQGISITPRSTANSSRGTKRHSHSVSASRATPLDSLQQDDMTVKRSSAATKIYLPSELAVEEGVTLAVHRLSPTSDLESVPSLPSPGTSEDQTASPAALSAFLGTLPVPCEHLAPIFIANGFDSDASLDFLCGIPVEGHWDEMKEEILKQGRLAGWLAINEGLKQRAQSVRAQVA